MITPQQTAKTFKDIGISTGVITFFSVAVVLVVIYRSTIEIKKLKLEIEKLNRDLQKK